MSCKPISKKSILLTLLLAAVIFSQFIFSVQSVFAQGEGEGSDSFKVTDWLNIKSDNNNTNQIEYSYFTACKDQGISPLACFVVRTVNYLSGIIGTICFVMIIIGGAIMMTSQGNETQVSKGKEILTNSIIGLVVALSAYVITLFVQSIFYT